MPHFPPQVCDLQQQIRTLTQQQDLITPDLSAAPTTAPLRPGPPTRQDSGVGGEVEDSPTILHSSNHLYKDLDEGGERGGGGGLKLTWSRSDAGSKSRWHPFNTEMQLMQVGRPTRGIMNYIIMQYNTKPYSKAMLPFHEIGSRPL